MSEICNWIKTSKISVITKMENSMADADRIYPAREKLICCNFQFYKLTSQHKRTFYKTNQTTPELNIPEVANYFKARFEDATLLRYNKESTSHISLCSNL